MRHLRPVQVKWYARHDGASRVRVERGAVSPREDIGRFHRRRLRPSLYAAQGYGSLFEYCTHVLRLSEDAACTRTRVARVCRRFPVILDLLSSGAISLSAVRLLGPHLTAENHEAILARATGKRLQDVQALVAELAPRPDVPASMRKLPGAAVPASSLPDRPLLLIGGPEATGTDSMAAAAGSASETGVNDGGTADGMPSGTADGLTVAAGGADGPSNRATRSALSAPSPAVPRTARPVLQPLAPQRYGVQFTIGQETHDAVKRLQALMRRELPDGDLGAIFDQGVRLLLEKIEKAKFGVGVKRRPETVKAGPAGRTYETGIRFKTDSESESVPVEPRSDGNPALLRREPPSRHIPSAVKRAVWRRDGGQCAFVSAGGRRCTERAFLELHHIHPHALDGPATVANISLRCRRHNAYEAELVFGPRAAPAIGDAG